MIFFNSWCGYLWVYLWVPMRIRHWQYLWVLVWPMGFWLVALGDPWEKIFTDLGAKFGTQIPVGTDLGHPQVHSCLALCRHQWVWVLSTCVGAWGWVSVNVGKETYQFETWAEMADSVWSWHCWKILATVIGCLHCHRVLAPSLGHHWVSTFLLH